MTEPPSDERLFREAAEWFARMRAPDAESSRAEFEAWLGRDAAHRAAYNRASEIFAMGKLLAADDKGKEPAGRPGRSGKAWLEVALAAVAAGVAVIGWIAVGPGGEYRGPASAGRGEDSVVTVSSDTPRQIRLADGSLVRLQPRTRLSIVFDAAIRRVGLQAGEARFDVAHEPRPFIVSAGGGSVIAHGTIFDVRLSAGSRVTVRLIEGMVDVRLPHRAERTAAVRRLRPGDALTFDGGQAAGVSGTPRQQGSAASDAGPAEGPSDYEGVSVAELVERANSRSHRLILLAEPGLGPKKVSGRFSIDDPDLLAERLAALFGLAVDHSDSGATILRRR